MKRWSRRIGVLLILGGLTSVAVAWILSAVGQPRPIYRSFPSHADGNRWIVEVSTSFGRAKVSRVPDNGRWSSATSNLPNAIPLWSRAIHRPTDDVRDDPIMPWWHELASGWPAVCGYAEVRTNVFTAGGQHIPRSVWFATSGLMVVPDDPKNADVFYRVLPVRPIWGGLLINTLFYAVVWYGILFTLIPVRSAFRRHRGRCPNCAYELRGQFDGGCPECGWNRPVM